LILKENKKRVLSAGVNAGGSTTAACQECVTYRKTLQVNIGLVVNVFRGPICFSI